jgi:malate dehydrogenase (oxaloacetate-decarboxylating)
MSMEFHDVLRVRILHKPGYMAKVCATVADLGAILGDIETVATGGETSVRDITIEARDAGTVDGIVERLDAIPGIEVVSHVDRVFDRHRGGKIRVASRVTVEKISDLRQIYTPGVARVCRAIEKEPDLARELTWRASSVAICTNGTRVLGLGDIGPVASLPVMEGKAVLYDRCIGLSGVPILVNAKDAKTFVETVARIALSFGGIHLEDISAPECFEIEAELARRLDMPVMHDDRHGTAVAALVAAKNACRLVGLDLKTLRVGMIGAGAAGTGITELLLAHGVGEMLVTDRNPDFVARLVKEGARAVDFAGLLREADVVIAATGKAGLIPAASVRKGQVILALSNPEAEIEPEAALAAGASFAATGASVNNLLGFPGLFKGALDAQSDRISSAMKLAAVEAIIRHTPEGSLTPDGLDRSLHEEVARVAREAAIAGGHSRLKSQRATVLWSASGKGAAAPKSPPQKGLT